MHLGFTVCRQRRGVRRSRRQPFFSAARRPSPSRGLLPGHGRPWQDLPFPPSAGDCGHSLSANKQVCLGGQHRSWLFPPSTQGDREPCYLPNANLILPVVEVLSPDRGPLQPLGEPPLCTDTCWNGAAPPLCCPLLRCPWAPLASRLKGSRVKGLSGIYPSVSCHPPLSAPQQVLLWPDSISLLQAGPVPCLLPQLLLTTPPWPLPVGPWAGKGRGIHRATHPCVGRPFCAKLS